MNENAMKKILVTLATAIALAFPTVMLTASPTSADTPGCYTKREYRKVHKGMKIKRVHRIFDTQGWLVDGGGGGFIRAYKGCLPRGHVAYITYRLPAHPGPARIWSKREINDD